MGCGGDEPAAPVAFGFEDRQLESYGIAVLPDPSLLASLLERPEEPFVMANMLVFKEAATGAGFEGLTGAEAYQIYVDGLVDAQAAIGSRFIWGGAVQAQVVGRSDPVFHSIGLLEYASPSAFLGFASKPGEAPEARTAGLRGQWLVASTTVVEQEAAAKVPAPELPSKAELVATTGLSAEQLDRLLAGPSQEPVFIVELLRFAGDAGQAYQPYRDALAPVVKEQGGWLVWRGAYGTFVMGESSPSFQEMVVTGYPSRASYLAVLADQRIVAATKARIDGLELHWIYAVGDAQSALSP